MKIVRETPHAVPVGEIKGTIPTLPLKGFSFYSNTPTHTPQNPRPDTPEDLIHPLVGDRKDDPWLSLLDDRMLG